MDHIIFSRNGTFYRLRPLDFRTTMSGRPPIDLFAFTRMIEDGVKELGISGLRAAVWSSPYSPETQVFNILSSRWFTRPEDACVFVGGCLR